MDFDKFLKSQTFKTGAFILLVLFVLLIVFKLGVIHGYKKTNFSHKFDTNRHRIIGSTIFGNQSYQRGTFNNETFKKVILKKQLIKDKSLLNLTEKNDSDTVEIEE